MSQTELGNQVQALDPPTPGCWAGAAVQSPLTMGKAGEVVTEAGQSLEVAWCVLLWTGEEGLSWN